MKSIRKCGSEIGSSLAGDRCYNIEMTIERSGEQKILGGNCSVGLSYTKCIIYALRLL